MNTKEFVKILPNGNYQLLKDLSVPTDRIDKSLTVSCKWFYVQKGVIIIDEGFEWDGCTGSRDGKKDENNIPCTWIGSCSRDALCKAISLIDGFKISQKTADQILRDKLIEANYKFLNILPTNITGYMYYAGVRLFGRFF